MEVIKKERVVHHPELGALHVNIDITNHFSITWDGGVAYEEILEFAPELKPLVDMHLADRDGTPIFIVSNGVYLFEQGKRETLQRHLRVSPEELDEIWAALEKAEDKKKRMEAIVDSLRPRWKEEADRAIELAKEWEPAPPEFSDDDPLIDIDGERYLVLLVEDSPYGDSYFLKLGPFFRLLVFKSIEDAQEAAVKAVADRAADEPEWFVEAVGAERVADWFIAAVNGYDQIGQFINDLRKYPEEEFGNGYGTYYARVNPVLAERLGIEHDGEWVEVIAYKDW